MPLDLRIKLQGEDEKLFLKIKQQEEAKEAVIINRNQFLARFVKKQLRVVANEK